MHVIGHQHIGVQRTVLGGQGLAQPAQIEPTIGVAEENRLSIVATLDHVMGLAAKRQSGSAGHGHGTESRLTLMVC